MLQRTFVLIKPEGVKRHLVGRILNRFEDAGLKIVALKQIWIDEEFALKHYTEDISLKHGEKVRDHLKKYLIEGPVVAFVLEGINSIEVVRKMVGGTEPRTAPPGTIRGDFCHVSYSYADKKEIAVKNVIHASGDEKDALREIDLWFKPNEIHTYESVSDLLM
jgi:nucleoside-diphosphate kinase